METQKRNIKNDPDNKFKLGKIGWFIDQWGKPHKGKIVNIEYNDTDIFLLGELLPASFIETVELLIDEDFNISSIVPYDLVGSTRWEAVELWEHDVYAPVKAMKDRLKKYKRRSS